MKENLEKRMYFFVPYNLSPIQQAIQAGHAALEYADKFGDEEIFIDFVRNWKTWIILNGGTTNQSLDENDKLIGTLDILHEDLWIKDIDHSLFYEPDLNNALTAICFICDERVFNYEDYPDFPTWVKLQDSELISHEEKLRSYMSIENFDTEKLLRFFPGLYPAWINEMGGEQNVFLRELIKGKKLA